MSSNRNEGTKVLWTKVRDIDMISDLHILFKKIFCNLHFNIMLVYSRETSTFFKERTTSQTGCDRAFMQLRE